VDRGLSPYHHNGGGARGSIQQLKQRAGSADGAMGSDVIRIRPPRDGDDRACFQVVRQHGQVRRQQRAACSSDVSRSAQRRRTTDGRVAPRAAASSSPKSVSEETISRALAAAYLRMLRSGAVSSRTSPTWDGLQSLLAQGSSDFRRQVGIGGDTHVGYAEWASGSSRSCTAATANFRAYKASHRRPSPTPWAVLASGWGGTRGRSG
jgi:hypothetical protein